LLFVFFLVKIPSFINDEVNYENSFTSFESLNKPGKILEQTKIDTIGKDILFDIKNRKVEDTTQIPYLVNLILKDKINNIENSLGQEIISFYLNNNSEIAINLSRELIEYKLNQFDEEKEWRWRNYLFYIINGEKSFILYNQSNILRSVYDSEIIALNSVEIKPYKKQIYHIHFKNDSKKSIEVDLLTQESTENISKYIDSEEKKNVKSINSQFAEAENSYIFKILIWK
ncbi:MAG: hypothetical protein KC589_11515, partial [Nanoarchaeota archaeon]|nr:hypothetical protein [Nanoarchaeota archaeon]